VHFFDLDIRTLILLLVWGNLASAALLLTYRTSGEARHPYRVFISGKMLQAGAWFLMAQRGDISDLLSVYAGNSLLIAGFACETLALIALFDKRRQWVVIQAGLAVAGAVVFSALAYDVGNRIAVSSLVTIAQYLPPIGVMLRAPLTSPLRKGTVALYGTFVIVVGARAWYGFTSPASLLSPGVIQSASFLMLILLMFIGGTAFILLLKEQADRQLAASEKQTEILSGLLPICAHCKKIRDDQGYWNQIESYIRSRSAAEFSHSICPECLPKLYPDLAEEALATAGADVGTPAKR
jgi:hypothetical protein